MKAHFSKYIIIYGIISSVIGVVLFEVVCIKCTGIPFDPYSKWRGGDLCDKYLLLAGVTIAIPLWVYYRFFDK